MTEETNNQQQQPQGLPPLTADTAQSPEQVMLDEIRPYLLDPRKDYPEPYCLLEYQGIGMSAFGGVQAVAGQKKNGKSFLMTQLMAAVLANPQGERTREHLAGLTVPQRTIDWLGHPPRVLYIDTEMEQLYSARVLRRVHWLCGWDLSEPNERFNVLWLKTQFAKPRQPETEEQQNKREEQIYQWRLRMIKYAIDVLTPDVVFIDGIRDVVKTINDEEVAGKLLEDFGAMASQRNMCIWCALHYNPRPGNDDPTKMRGWLGSELGNKANTVLVSTKHKDAGTGRVEFTVSQADTRDQDIEDWKYEVTDAAGRLGIPHILNGSNYISDERRKARAEADELFRQYPWTNLGARYTDIDRWMRTEQKMTSSRKREEMWDLARSEGIVYQNEPKGKYYYRQPGQQPPAETEDLPFEQADNNEVPF